MNEKTKAGYEVTLKLILAFGSIFLAAIFSTGMVIMMVQDRFSEIPVAFWSVWAVAVSPYIPGVKEVVGKVKGIRVVKKG